MAGYTPLFSSLTTGTLCGKWPDIGLWPIILSMADKHGVVDVTPAYIAGVTGLNLDDVVACMRRFCEPDPYSRSDELGGARLKLIDDHRDWGWQIVNHGHYREKARLAAKMAREVEEGKNRSRMEARRPALVVSDRRSPPLTAADPPSNANAYSNREREALSLSEISIPECPKDLDAVIEHEACSQYYAERQQAVTPSVWRSWVLRAVKSGVYAKRGSRPPTEEEIQSTRRACIARMAAEG